MFMNYILSGVVYTVYYTGAAYISGGYNWKPCQNTQRRFT